MTAQQWSWVAASVAFVLALTAGFADSARQRRSRLDDIGWVPWRGIQVAAMFALLLALILSFKLAD